MSAWIKRSERMPSAVSLVWVIRDNAKGGCVGIAQPFDDKWAGPDGLVGPVTHWMPLPEPPTTAQHGDDSLAHDRDIGMVDKPTVAPLGHGDPCKDENYWHHECARLNAVVGNLHADYRVLLERVVKERDDLKQERDELQTLVEELTEDNANLLAKRPLFSAREVLPRVEAERDALKAKVEELEEQLAEANQRLLDRPYQSRPGEFATEMAPDFAMANIKIFQERADHYEHANRGLNKVCDKLEEERDGYEFALKQMKGDI